MDETYWVSCLRENLTSSSYGEGLETGRNSSIPRQFLTRQLVFKRMKSILGLGHLPKKDPLSAQAWLEGKLLVGLLIERMVDAAASFFPWGYPLATTSQPMAGN